VLVLDTTSGQPPRAFATQVFNAWGVGHGGRDDGVLLFVALADRKSEIILGRGSKVTSVDTDQVMRDQVVANLKRGQTEAGLTNAARALATLMKARQGATPTKVAPVARPEVDEKLMAFVRREARFPEASPRSWVVDLSESLSAADRARLNVSVSDLYAEDKGRVFFLIVARRGTAPELGALVGAFARQVTVLAKTPLAVVAWDTTSESLALHVPPDRLVTAQDGQQLAQLQEALAAKIAANRVTGLEAAGKQLGELLQRGPPPRPMTDVLSQGFRQHAAPVAGGVGLSAVGGLVFLRRWLRRRPRTCENCHQPRELLSEADDDAHLSEGERTEEALGSVNYDVWWCERCQDALVLDHSALFSRYSRCPRCQLRTQSSNSITLQSATEYSEGLVQVDETCAACSHHHTYTRSTSRLSSSSDWSDSSSSSSSDSSFGGGSSDGGGSSGSW
jgi:uncharacterized membrane protein YgcG